MDSPVFLRHIGVLVFIGVGICYATLRDKQPFTEGTVCLSKKITRQAFVMPA